MKFLLMALIRFYRRFISPLMPPVCRFEPSCSKYTLDAIDHHGAIKGSALGAWRILRCNPFTAGGHDPVPGLAGPVEAAPHLDCTHPHPPGET